MPPADRAAAKALALAGLDLRGEALEQIALLGAQGFGSIPRNAVWMTTLVLVLSGIEQIE